METRTLGRYLGSDLCLGRKGRTGEDAGRNPGTCCPLIDQGCASGTPSPPALGASATLIRSVEEVEPVEHLQPGGTTLGLVLPPIDEPARLWEAAREAEL